MQKHLKQLDSKIRDNIQSFVNASSKESKKIDTTNIIYSLKEKFKSTIEEGSQTVVFNRGDKERKISVDTGKRKNKKRKKVIVQPKVVKNRPKKSDSRNSGEQTSTKKRYDMRPSDAKRVVINDVEILKINFEAYEFYKGEESCNIYYYIIDGEGGSNDIDLSLLQIYDDVLDLNTNKKLEIHEKYIKNVSITNCEINLKLHFKPKSNHNLKFVYYVEV